MKKVVLIFPDTISLADFLLTHQPSNIDANTTHCTLSGRLPEDLIAIACTTFGAELKPVQRPSVFSWN